MKTILRSLFSLVILAVVFVISDSSGISNKVGSGGTLIGAPVCKDDHKACPHWSKAGECEKNKEWMWIHCKKSCGKCDDPCFDVNVKCGEWASEGECDKNPNYMLIYCPKSCDSCDVDSVIYILKECIDQHTDCPKWTKDGECQQNAKWMLTNCAKSCDSCV